MPGDSPQTKGLLKHLDLLSLGPFLDPRESLQARLAKRLNNRQVVQSQPAPTPRQRTGKPLTIYCYDTCRL